ncbi:MAG: hypothetical protein K2Q09_09385 [Phycisphaerales bacterium]|nr:hypothetical protein [Phycisphaerales bacterium]
MYKNLLLLVAGLILAIVAGCRSYATPTIYMDYNPFKPDEILIVDTAKGTNMILKIRSNPSGGWDVQLPDGSWKNFPKQEDAEDYLRHNASSVFTQWTQADCDAIADWMSTQNLW